jgi:NAD(P)-dependent dehydrogenase (short-subunit alcohol dehydrogenase family)
MVVQPTTLIVGGTSGLGLALATMLTDRGQRVCVTGRCPKKHAGHTTVPLAITEHAKELSAALDVVLDEAGEINLLIYAAGFYQWGGLPELNEAEVLTMVNVGLVAPMLLLQKVLQRQGRLGGFIAITSTSQWIARQNEPVYAAAKAGLGMLAESVALGGVVQKTFVVGPAGLATPLWKGTERGGTLLDPEWVAARILELFEHPFRYRAVKILRDPPRIVEVHSRM